MFRKLDAEQIVATASRLERRIEERFPDAGLGQLAQELTQVTREAHALSAWLAAPNKPLRLGVTAAILGLLSVVLAAAATLRGETGPHNWADWVQSLVRRPITVSAAGAVEDLAINLSRTIWQKIVILDRVTPTATG